MRHIMPTSLIVAEAAIGVNVVYSTVVLVLDIRYGKFPLTIIHLAWAAFAAFGIPFRYRPAWSLACIATALLGLISAFGVAVSLFLGLVGSELFVPFIIWYSCCAVYYWAIYYLLRRPSVISYFGDGKGDAKKSVDTIRVLDK
jgi:hypothetical protein